MKVRSGFVSNSSSSSFIVVGAEEKFVNEKVLLEKLVKEYNIEDEDLDDVWYELDCAGCPINLVDAESGNAKIGIVICEGDIDYGTLNSFSLSLEELQEKIDTVKEHLGDCVNSEHIKLYGGTQMC